MKVFYEYGQIIVNLFWSRDNGIFLDFIPESLYINLELETRRPSWRGFLIMEE